MMYGELTREQKEVRQKLWVVVLDKYCPPLFEDGTRHCDMGMPCDRCHYDWDTQLEYVKLLKKEGQQLLTDEVEKYGEYL